MDSTNTQQNSYFSEPNETESTVEKCTADTRMEFNQSGGDAINKEKIGNDKGNEKSLKRKREDKPTTSKMVIKTIKILNMSNGAPVEAINEYIGEYYGLNTNTIRPKIKRLLDNGVENGILEQVRDDGNVERFKIKDTEKTPIETTPKATGQTDLKNKIRSPEMPPKKKMAKTLYKPSTSEMPPKKQMAKTLYKPPTSEMVLQTIKSLKMQNGASAGSIREYMGKKYDVNIKTITPHLNKFLKSGVEKGMLQQVSGAGGEVRFKIKKMEGLAIQAKNKVTEKTRKPPDFKRDAKTYAISKKKSSTLTPAMVVESIKSLKMRKGAPVESIRQYIEKHYGLRLTTMMSNIKRYLRNGVQKGILEQVDGTGATGRFKIKKMEGIKMNKRMLKI